MTWGPKNKCVGRVEVEHATEDGPFAGMMRIACADCHEYGTWMGSSDPESLLLLLLDSCNAKNAAVMRCGKFFFRQPMVRAESDA
jgi:hypothetical protein